MVGRFVVDREYGIGNGMMKLIVMKLGSIIGDCAARRIAGFEQGIDKSDERA